MAVSDDAAMTPMASQSGSGPSVASPDPTPSAPTPPAAPRERLGREERRRQLLDAAREVFVASGYHAAAMDDIAAKAGISKPVLYQHFPGKLELYLALLDSGVEQLIAAVREALASTTDNEERVVATMAAYFTFMADPDSTFRLVFESDLTAEPAVRERVDRMTHECTVAVASVIADDTDFDHEPAMLLAAGLTGAAQVAARWWLTKDGDIPRATAERLVASLAWRGISGFPRSDDGDGVDYPDAAG
ncbi:MAG TPA: TetR/AcrR family transcriptional regulator [Actinomycetes bacterium]|nr:TetR/AcrR family transcriptional regulator [Actinomycetes bacterium]